MVAPHPSDFAGDAEAGSVVMAIATVVNAKAALAPNTVNLRKLIMSLSLPGHDRNQLTPGHPARTQGNLFRLESAFQWAGRK